MTEVMGLQPFLTAYPNLAEWVMGMGWMELGQDEYSISLIRVLDEGVRSGKVTVTIRISMKR